MSVWRCPICAASMQHEEHSLHCLNGHCFDLAKSGYVNLLPVQQKHTKQPGDNLQMVRARRDFLQAGYYQPFQQALCAMVVQAMPQQGILFVIASKIATMACKMAIKGNQRVSLMEVEHLLDELMKLENPYQCPHGRPTIIKMSKYEIDKKFKRIV